MKLLKLIPAAAIALTTFGVLDAFADSNSKQTTTYNLYCAANSGNKWYHQNPKKDGGHKHSCDAYTQKVPYDGGVNGYPYCSKGSEPWPAANMNGTCSKN